LPEHFYHFFAAAGEAATGATQCFTQGTGDDVNLTHHTPVFVRAPAGFT
jgi:hypothetical protein